MRIFKNIFQFPVGDYVCTRKGIRTPTNGFGDRHATVTSSKHLWKEADSNR